MTHHLKTPKKIDFRFYYFSFCIFSSLISLFSFDLSLRWQLLFNISILEKKLFIFIHSTTVFIFLWNYILRYFFFLFITSKFMSHLSNFFCFIVAPKTFFHRRVFLNICFSAFSFVHFSSILSPFFLPTYLYLE